MIQEATKYTRVAMPMKPASGRGLEGAPGRTARPSIPVMSAADRLPGLGRGAIDRKTPVQTFGPKQAGARAPQIMVPSQKMMIRWDEWMWKELRGGGFLMRYIEAEKAQSAQRARRVARQMRNVSVQRQATNTWDWELKAAIPAREFFRWKAMDPDFWRDDNNLRSLKRDNPDLCIYNVGSRRTAGRKTY